MEVLEYRCPCCNAGLVFGSGAQKLTCEYCDNSFDLETVRAYNEIMPDSEEIGWEESQNQAWSEEEQNSLHTFQCPSCGGEILSDEHTAATFCPYCDNPTILPSRLSGSIRPDALIPFQTTKEDARTAFLALCKGKPLLPKGFCQEQRLERITGMYIPFWLYDCSSEYESSFKATRVRHWADSNYNYTKTDHYLLQRKAEASFRRIPMDGSTKADDTFMESIEPFDYSQLVDFDMAYLTGYLADKYDVPSQQGEERIRQRVDEAMRENIGASVVGYTTAIPTSRQLRVKNSRVKYVLLPVWMLNTNYRGKVFTFAMNGQTGRIAGTLPICPRRTAKLFAAVFTGVTIFMSLLRLFI